jgi:hypothetical protein
MSDNYNEIALAKAEDVLDEEKNREFTLKALAECNRWRASEVELAQGRSNFQIEKFIIHDNFTIPSAFKAAVINRKSVAEGLLSSIQEAKKNAREFDYKWEGKDKSKPIWWKTREGGEELCWYDIDEFHFHRFVEGLNSGFKSQIDELTFFDKVIEKLIELNGGHPPTKEEFDADQPVYWERRFANQALDELLAAQTGVSGGNIRSMRRATAPTVLDDDINRIKEGYADPTNAMAFLESLQKHVASGIEEISGMTEKLLEGKEETKQLAQEKVSLFNNDLRQ